MPKLEPKQVQKELESGKVWPVYWIYGGERMKARELLKRIRKVVLPEGATFGEENLDGAEVSGRHVVDAAQTMALGGGLRFVVVRDAHAMKEADAITELLEVDGVKGARKLEELGSVCVFLSKELDGRKKLSKTLIDRGAVVPCEEIPEGERDGWIGYLAKRRGMTLEGDRILRLRGLDPWNLDIVDQELEKLSLSGGDDVVLDGANPDQGGEIFLTAFFARDAGAATRALAGFADHPDESLPLLGLLGWNARFLAVSLSGARGPVQRTNPYLAERLTRWSKLWTLDEAIALQESLASLDFQLKQTARLSLGAWTELTLRFCR